MINRLGSIALVVSMLVCPAYGMMPRNKYTKTKLPDPTRKLVIVPLRLVDAMHSKIGEGCDLGGLQPMSEEFRTYKKVLRSTEGHPDEDNATCLELGLSTKYGKKIPRIMARTMAQAECGKYDEELARVRGSKAFKEARKRGRQLCPHLSDEALDTGAIAELKYMQGLEELKTQDARGDKK